MPSKKAASWQNRKGEAREDRHRGSLIRRQPRLSKRFNEKKRKVHASARVRPFKTKMKGQKEWTSDESSRKKEKVKLEGNPEL